jgi:tetratricopeptide (TPR) repeat protein
MAMNFARNAAFLQVSFFRQRQLQIIAVVAFGLLLPGCQPESVRQEKTLRRQLVHELRNHSYATAAPIARQLLQRKPRDERIWKQLVQAQIGLHDLDGAKQSLQRWRSVIPSTSIRADEFQGDIAREEHDYQTALSNWEKVVGSQPNNHRVRQKVALLHQTLERWIEADSDWGNTLNLKESLTARLNRAICRRRLHRWNDAFDDYARAQKLGPDDPEVRRWSKVFDGLQKYKEQIAEIDAKIALLPDEFGLLGDRALLFLRSQDPEMALEDAEHAGKLASWALRPKLFQGIALVQLNRGRQLDSVGLRRPLSLETLSPEFLETASRLDLAIAVERTNPEHFITRSWNLNEIGQPKLALADAEDAARLDPRSASALTELAYALTKLGRSDEAYDKLRQATEFDTNSAAAWLYRGELEMVRGDYLAAVDSLSRAAGIHQTVAVLQKRAECYQHLGLNARAEEDHRTVQKLLSTAVQ